MYIYVFICAYIRSNKSEYAYTYIYKYCAEEANLWLYLRTTNQMIQIYMHILIYIYMCMNPMIRIYIHILVYIYMYTHIYSSIVPRRQRVGSLHWPQTKWYVFIYIYLYSYTYIRIQIHTYIHTHTYTHIHIQVLCRGGKALALSTDHKPNDAGERARITKAGGFVAEAQNGHYRMFLTHTHTHTCIYVYTYVYICIYVCMYIYAKAGGFVAEAKNGHYRMFLTHTHTQTCVYVYTYM